MITSMSTMSYPTFNQIDWMVVKEYYSSKDIVFISLGNLALHFS